jgi:hypothetical protein
VPKVLWNTNFVNIFLNICLNIQPGVKETDLPFQSNREIRAFECLLPHCPLSEVEEVEEESAEVAVLWRGTHGYKPRRVALLFDQARIIQEFLNSLNSNFK